MRGTVSPEAAELYQDRITPACAGNRKLRSNMAGSRKDHPRVCGEQSVCRTSSATPMGSPPRVRGTEGKKMESIIKEGITPACAGNRYLSAKPRRRHEDHPRVCGEQMTMATWEKTKEGSPPRVRGTAAHAGKLAI